MYQKQRYLKGCQLCKSDFQNVFVPCEQKAFKYSVTTYVKQWGCVFFVTQLAQCKYINSKIVKTEKNLYSRAKII